MEAGSPEAGLPIERDMVFVTALNRVLVEKHGAKVVLIRFLIDSQRTSGIDGHYEMEHELKDGAMLKVHCKQSEGDMFFKVFREGTQLNYSVPVSTYVSEDLVPISPGDYEELVDHWLNDLQ